MIQYEKFLKTFTMTLCHLMVRLLTLPREDITECLIYLLVFCNPFLTESKSMKHASQCLPNHPVHLNSYHQPSQIALVEYIKRPIYQAEYLWGNLLLWNKPYKVQAHGGELSWSVRQNPPQATRAGQARMHNKAIQENGWYKKGLVSTNVEEHVTGSHRKLHHLLANFICMYSYRSSYHLKNVCYYQMPCTPSSITKVKTK